MKNANRKPMSILIGLVFCVSPASGKEQSAEHLPLEQFKSFNNTTTLNAPTALLQRIAAMGYSPNQPDHNGLTPLIKAVINGDPERTKALIKAGANPTYVDGNNLNLMEIASDCWSELRSTDVCQYPVNRGVWYIPDYDYSRAETIEILTSYGLESPSVFELLSISLDKDSRLFDWAIERAHLLTDKEIKDLASNLSFYFEDIKELTLIAEANKRNIQILFTEYQLKSLLRLSMEKPLQAQDIWSIVLLVHKDINTPMRWKSNTILMELVKLNSGYPYGLVDLMLNHGADPNQTNKDGLSARDMAKALQAQGEDTTALTPLL